MKGINLNESNGNWKGDNASLNAIHLWVKRRIKKPKSCEKCGQKNDKLDLANISQKYLRKLDDWEWLCRRCHMKSDKRLDKLIKNSNKKVTLRNCIICGEKTFRLKYCKTCAKEQRILWWKKYNNSKKRKEYLSNYYKKIKKGHQ